jgi:GH35 family endo-1,4-beta-xylanase
MNGKYSQVRMFLRPVCGLGCGAAVLALALAVAGSHSAAAAVRPTPGVFTRSPVHRSPILGAAVNTEMLRSADPRYARTLLRHFQSVTPEYEMKMDHLEPAQGVFDFARADEIVAFARRHGLEIRGHTLVWDEQIPAWVTDGGWTRAQLRSVLVRYITTVVSHYRGRIDEWDVVNEPLMADGSLRPSIWERVLGPGYIELALRTAHRADPRARLFVNEYGAEYPGPKERALYRLVKRLRAEGVRIDGVGFQAHLSIHWSPTRAQFTGVLRRFAALGLRVEVTELDVAAAGSAPLRHRLAEQAAVYRSVAADCRAVRACSRVTIWGVTDAASWLGAAQRPLPFDAGYRAKPAWSALRAGLGE